MMLMMSAGPLEVTGVIRRDAPGALRIEITGDIDDYGAPALRDVLDLAVAEHPARLDLDLSGVTYFSCAGLATANGLWLRDTRTDADWQRLWNGRTTWVVMTPGGGLRPGQYANARRAIRTRGVPDDPGERSAAVELAQQRLSGQNSPWRTAAILGVPLIYALYAAASGRVPHWPGVALMSILIGASVNYQLRSREGARRYLALTPVP